MCKPDSTTIEREGEIQIQASDADINRKTDTHKQTDRLTHSHQLMTWQDNTCQGTHAQTRENDDPWPVRVELT